MDNQNSNQINGLNNESVNQVPNKDINNNMSTQNVNMGENNSEFNSVTIDNVFNATPVTPNETGSVSNLSTPEVPIENIEPVKPSLDAILNSNVDNLNVINNAPSDMASNIDNVNLETKNIAEPTTIMSEPVDSALNVNQPVEQTINELPSDAVVDNSGVGLNEPINLNINNTPVNMVETPISTNNTNSDTEASGGIVNTINMANESPVIETIENVSTPVNNNISDNSNSTIDSNGSGSTIVNQMPNNNSPEPTPVDNFDAVPRPPIFEDEGKKKKNKKGNSKALVLLLVIILIALVGFGVYYFLNMAKSKANSNIVSAKEVKIELGDALPTDLGFYANISGYQKSDCTLNIDNVDINKVGTSKYTITCGKQTEEGLVIIDDTKPPKVVTNDLVVLINSTLKAEDFIDSCNDASGCSYAFITDVTSLTNKVGDYDLEILVSDEYNNQTTVTAHVSISKTAPASYLTCTKPSSYLEDIQANYGITYKIGLDNNNAFMNANKTAEFVFDSLENYNNNISSYNEAIGINGVTGTPNFNEENKTISIKASNMTLEDLNKDLNGNTPSDANVLKAFLTVLGYSCR